MSDKQFVCNYCDEKWILMYVPHILRCPKCNSKEKDIRVIKDTEEERDVFGYNYKKEDR